MPKWENTLPAYLLLLILAAPFRATAQESAERPNIIFILTDDQRYDALGHAGNALAHTPEMDRLAATGTYFPNALVTTPICAASRASILSGVYERTHRFNFQTGNIREEYMATAYPRLLREHGYRTAFYGKYGIRYPQEHKLFDEHEVYDRNNAFRDKRGYFYQTLNGDTVHLTRYTGQQALDYLGRQDGKESFCLSLSFSAPHAHDRAEDQYFWQAEQDALLSEGPVPAPALGAQKFFDVLPKVVRDGFNRTRWHWRYDTPEKYQHSVKGYFRMIAGIDREIGKIRQKLEEKGLADNTVIILMGDNGYFLGERGLAGKWLMYDKSVRVPLIINDPRARPQVRSEVQALNIDVPATIAALAGAPIPAGWQGQSLLPIVNGQEEVSDRDTVLIEHIWDFEHIPPSEGVRTREWKYFRYVDNRQDEELYHLSKDPQEINNLASDPTHQATLAALRQKCNALISRYTDANGAPPTNLQVEYLRQPGRVALVDDRPEFGWEVPRAAVAQSGYQILVASSREVIDANRGDVWNSGNVRSSSSINLAYTGPALQKGQTYFWKVRIWDERNRLTDYSTAQAFHYGGPTGDGMITTGNAFQVERISPVGFSSSEKGSYTIDFGRAAFGNMELTYTAKRKHELSVRIGEKTDANGVIDRDPPGHVRTYEVVIPVAKGTHTYQLPLIADERNTKPLAVQMPDSFPVIAPFRFVEIAGARAAIKAQDVKQIAYFNYWENDRSSFSSSDPILNQLWDFCKYSIKATSFAGLYVDGDRERIPYEADAYLNQLSHYTTDQEYAIARRTIEYFMDYPTWPTEWQQHVALMFHADYLYTGNTELIEKYYEPLKHKALVELVGENGLVSSTRVTPAFMKKLGFGDRDETLKDITDWPPANWQGNPEVTGERDGFVFCPDNTVINALFYRNMQIMAEFADLLDKPAEKAEFEFLAAKAKRAVNELLFDREKGIYLDGGCTDHSSIHANMFPLAFGMVPKAYEASVVDFIKSRGLACSVYGSQYLLDGLYRAGAADYALELMTSTDKRSWYNMIREGATISMEAWGQQFKPNQDWNHAWGAVPANAIPRRLWGIRPLTAGYGVAEIRPQLGALTNSSIQVPTLRGDILAEFQRVNPRLDRYTITIPGNMAVSFRVPPVKGREVSLNGDKANLAFGDIRLGPGVHRIEVRLNSF